MKIYISKGVKMERETKFSIINKKLAITIMSIILLFFLINILRNISINKIDITTLNNFCTIFISMILEGLPLL